MCGKKKEKKKEKSKEDSCRMNRRNCSKVLLNRSSAGWGGGDERRPSGWSIDR